MPSLTRHAKPRLTVHGAAIADKLRAGKEIRMHKVRRGTHTVARLGFSPTDTIALHSLDPLIAHGIAVVGPNGTIRHGGK